jgi:lipopolysaccharide export system protein LptA
MRLTIFNARDIFFTLLLSSSLLAVTGQVHAEKADSQKEMTIDTEHVVRDGKTGVSTLTGNVIITRGTLLVKAARAVITTTPDNFQHVTLFCPPGGKVTFRQKRDGGPDLWVDGEADKIEYDEKTEFAKFISKAKVRYLDGKKVTDEQDGEFLSYDSKNDVFVGTNSNNGESVAGAGRVRITIQPRTDKQGK